MNRGHLLQSSPLVQQMMAGSPNWWNMNNSMRPPSQQASSPLLAPTTPNLFPQFVPVQPSSSWSDNQELPDQSWSQLLFGGLVSDEDEKASGMQAKKLENWDQEQLLQQPLPNGSNNAVDDHVKQENSGNGYMYGHENVDQFHASAKPTWSSSPMMQVSSPTSCVTTLSSNNMLDFSSNKSDGRHPPPDRSSDSNSTAIGGAPKKARVQATSVQSSFKVRKEKLGDRVTALHQLVSPFGKTDTASVLLEAIGYIRFLQSQIEALSLPYLGCKSGNLRQQQHAQGDRNCLFPEDPGQLLNDNCMKKKAAAEQDSGEEPKKDLRSRGLCLVPVSCTLQVGSDNGADYWAPAYGGGFR